MGSGDLWRRVEDALLVIALLALLGLSITQITARNLFETGWIWSDQIVRVLVLWVGMLGAVVASREDRHLRIDLLSRSLGDCLRHIHAVFVHGCTAALCGVVAWHAVRFVLDERAFGGTSIAAVPGWVPATVIPFAFGLMCLRHLQHAITAATGAVRGR